MMTLVSLLLLFLLFIALIIVCVLIEKLPSIYRKFGKIYPTISHLMQRREHINDDIVFYVEISLISSHRNYFHVHRIASAIMQIANCELLNCQCAHAALSTEKGADVMRGISSSSHEYE